jgi:Tol biopolymer transport system component
LISSSYFDFNPQISPDGTRVALVSDRLGGNAVWVCNIDGSRCGRLTDPVGGCPRWSPDGTSIAYQTRDGDRDIYIISADGGSRRRLTSDKSADFFPNWSRDGRWIYFASERSGKTQVWKMPVDGGKARQITRGGGRDSLESPDGRTLYFSRRRPASSYKWDDIYKVPVGGGEESPVLEGEQLQSLNWTLWEDKIVYRHWVTNRTCVISQMDLKTRRVTELTRFEPELGGLRFAYGLTVSPDGRFLLYSKSVPLNHDLILVENFH